MDIDVSEEPTAFIISYTGVPSTKLHSVTPQSNRSPNTAMRTSNLKTVKNSESVDYYHDILMKGGVKVTFQMT
jgi:hypothetical protein